MMLNEPLDPSDSLHFKELAKPILIFQVIEGLRRGLSRFLGPSRVGLLLSFQESEPLLVFDPHGLLSEHQSEIRSHFLDSLAWRQHSSSLRGVLDANSCPGPELPRLICWGRRSASVYYQMWFAERPPNLCSAGPVEAWLAKASWILAHELAMGASLYTSSATHTLESYSLYAVCDHLIAQLRKVLQAEPPFRVEDVLKSVAGISTTYEEGKLAVGALMFLSPKALGEVTGIVRFPDGSCPSIKDLKHVRKLLTMVEGTQRFLVSNGVSILGIGHGTMPHGALLARFKGGHGELQLGSHLVCTFRDGEYSGLGRSPELHDLQLALGRKTRDMASRSKVLHAVAKLVKHAWDRSHGCTIVVDFGRPVRAIAGQRLEQPISVIDNLDLIEGMSKVDGALHIDSEGELHAFACLLDGRAVATEDRSRGARYNSALRFTADYPAALAVVVSADGPVSILESGRQINLPQVWSAQDSVYMTQPTLQDWLAAASPAQPSAMPQASQPMRRDTLT